MIDQGSANPGVRLLRSALMVLMKILFRIEHHGLHKIPRDGPLLLVCNHVTYFDPFWIATPIRRTTRFMAWDRIFEIPLAGAVFRWFGAFPVNLESPESSAFKTSLRVLNRGEALMIFPEGGRSPNGRLLPFKEGAARIALRTHAAVQPVVVFGGENVWASKMRLPRPGKVRVEYLDPIPPERLNTEPEALTRILHSILEERLARHRRPEEPG